MTAPRRKIKKNTAREEEKKAARLAEAKAIADEFRKNGPKIDEDIEWSDDEEQDWTVKSPTKGKRYNAEDEYDAIPDDRITEQPKVIVKENSEDYRRAKLKLRGDAYDKTKHSVPLGLKGVLPREVRVPNYSSYRLPIPVRVYEWIWEVYIYMQ